MTTLSIFVPVARAGLPKIKIAVAQQKLEKKNQKLTLHMKYSNFQLPAGLLLENFQGQRPNFRFLGLLDHC